MPEFLSSLVSVFTSVTSSVWILHLEKCTCGNVFIIYEGVSLKSSRNASCDYASNESNVLEVEIVYILGGVSLIVLFICS